MKIFYTEYLYKRKDEYFISNPCNFVNIEYLLNNSNLTINRINKMLNDYNGTEIYSIKLNVNNKEKIIAGIRMFLKFKYNINIMYGKSSHNDGIIYFNYQDLIKYFCWNEFNIKDIKIIYNLFDEQKIEKLNNLIVFDNDNYMKQFINEYNKLLTFY